MNQLSRWGFACALAAASVCGCGNSEKPFMPTPSVSAVSPAMVFLGRTKDVQVSGYATMWTDSTTIDFGPGVTVNKISAASSTGVIANITVAGNAMTGPRDVTVTDGTNMEVFKGAFDVESPIKVTVQGTLAQGSVAHLHIENVDRDNPFDTTWTQGGGLLGPPIYDNLSATGPAGSSFKVVGATPSSLDVTIFTDVDATVAMGDLDVASGPSTATQLHFVAPASLPITARSATPLMSGMNNGTVTMPFDSSLFTLVPGAGVQVDDFSLGATNSMSGLGVYFLPKSGHFADAIKPTGTLVTSSVDPYYLITYDDSGLSAYDFSIGLTQTAATAVAEGAQNDTKAQAQTIAMLPAVVQNATISSSTDEDWYAITVPAGKTVEVLTSISSDQATDTVVDVLENDGTTSLGGPSQDLDYLDDFTSTAAATAGTYYVKISAGSSYAAQDTKYSALIRVK